MHLEASSTQAWLCGNFYNPAELLGFPNEVGTLINYDGTIPPTPPTPPDPPTPPTPPTPAPPNYDWSLQKGFPWAVMTKKLKSERKNKNA